MSSLGRCIEVNSSRFTMLDSRFECHIFQMLFHFTIAARIRPSLSHQDSDRELGSLRDEYQDFLGAYPS